MQKIVKPNWPEIKFDSIVVRNTSVNTYRIDKDVYYATFSVSQYETSDGLCLGLGIRSSFGKWSYSWQPLRGSIAGVISAINATDFDKSNIEGGPNSQDSQDTDFHNMYSMFWNAFMKAFLNTDCSGKK